KATINQQPARNFFFFFTGRAVPLDVLTRWGWPERTTAPTGNTNLQLQLNARLVADTPLKPTLNGTLQGVDSNDHPIRQQMHQGAVTEAQ
ncbi:AsmA family protein, partial [Dickeya dadantii]|nr:AsmA family protein [Dickeya dadantii]